MFCAVDVLRRGPDEVDAPRLAERLHELLFKGGFGGEAFARPAPSDRGSFHQENVNVLRWVVDQRFD